MKRGVLGAEELKSWHVVAFSCPKDFESPKNKSYENPILIPILQEMDKNGS